MTEHKTQKKNKYFVDVPVGIAYATLGVTYGLERLFLKRDTIISIRVDKTDFAVEQTWAAHTCDEEQNGATIELVNDNNENVCKFCVQIVTTVASHTFYLNLEEYNRFLNWFFKEFDVKT